MDNNTLLAAAAIGAGIIIIGAAASGGSRGGGKGGGGGTGPPIEGECQPVGRASADVTQWEKQKTQLLNLPEDERRKLIWTRGTHTLPMVINYLKKFFQNTGVVFDIYGGYWQQFSNPFPMQHIYNWPPLKSQNSGTWDPCTFNKTIINQPVVDIIELNKNPTTGQTIPDPDHIAPIGCKEKRTASDFNSWNNERSRLIDMTQPQRSAYLGAMVLNAPNRVDALRTFLTAVFQGTGLVIDAWGTMWDVSRPINKDYDYDWPPLMSQRQNFNPCSYDKQTIDTPVWQIIQQNMDPATKLPIINPQGGTPPPPPPVDPTKPILMPIKSPFPAQAYLPPANLKMSTHDKISMGRQWLMTTDEMGYAISNGRNKNAWRMKYAPSIYLLVTRYYQSYGIIWSSLTGAGLLTADDQNTPTYPLAGTDKLPIAEPFNGVNRYRILWHAAAQIIGVSPQTPLHPPIEGPGGRRSLYYI